MLRRPVLFLMILSMIFITSPSSAVDLEKPARIRIIHGVFADGTEQINFSIPEGKGLILRNRETNTTYRLVPEKVNGNRVDFAVLDFASEQVVSRFYLGLDGKLRNSEGLSFSLGLTGVSVENTAKNPRSRLEKSTTPESGGLTTQGSCCVGCGIWEVCCYPSSGWCCDLECVGGDTCSACTAI